MSWNPGFPIIHYHGEELPKQGTYFVVASNGIWMHKDTGICRAFVPVKNIGFLEELNANVEMEVNLPKLPAIQVWEIKTFFKTVVDKYRSESGTILYYNKDVQDYKVHVPEQRVSHGGIHYRKTNTTNLHEMRGYLPVGTIHSHCDFQAFHSGTDVSDEEHFDGIHITFGHNNKTEFSISASVVINGNRIQVDPESLLDGIQKVSGEFYSIDEPLAYDNYWPIMLDSWLKQVNPCTSNPFWVNDQVELTDPNGLLKNIGEGPFRVTSIHDDIIVIQTPSGLTQMSHKLFKKVQNEHEKN